MSREYFHRVNYYIIPNLKPTTLDTHKEAPNNFYDPLQQIRQFIYLLSWIIKFYAQSTLL